MAHPRVTVTFRVPKVLNQNMKAYSTQCDITQNDLAIRAITQFLKEQGVKVETTPRFFSPSGQRRSRQLNQIA
jgi:hypothetical protein